MPNQNNSIPKNYDASDMHDMATMAKCDMAWMYTAIGHIRQEIIKLNKLAEDGKQIYDFHFADLIRHADMYEYIAEDRLTCHQEEAERYSKEWKKLKGGRNV